MRAFIVDRFEVSDEPERLLARLTEPDFDPRSTVLLGERPILSLVPEAGPRAAIQTVNGSPVRLFRGRRAVVTRAMLL